MITVGDELLGAAHDSPPGGRPHRVTYVVCSTPRCGSGLLCDALLGSGVAGVPAEYFNPRTRTALTARWGCAAGLGEYVAALRHHRTDAGGALGLKLHHHHLEAIAHEAGEPRRLGLRTLTALLGPELRLVRIRRGDLERQAVSLWVAQHTAVWSERADAPPRSSPSVPYRFGGIERCRAWLALEQLGWDQALDGHEVLEVRYEDLAADYEATATAVIRRLTGDGGAVAGPPARRRQGDGSSAALLERYQRDLDQRGPTRSLRRRDALLLRLRRTP